MNRYDTDEILRYWAPMAVNAASFVITDISW